MRLWHYKLIPYLPKSQLQAQWRELGSIFKKQDNHILINYIYKYDKETLYAYAQKVIQEMQNRNIKIRDWTNYNYYFYYLDFEKGIPVDNYFPEHNNEYLTICYWNLREKYIRGQKDFDDEISC